MKAGFAKVLSGKECSGRNGRGGRASAGLQRSFVGSGEVEHLGSGGCDHICI